MNDKIFEYLRTNYADLGLSKEILGGFADLLARTVTSEDGIETAVESIKPLLILQQKETDKIRQKYAEQQKKREQSQLDEQKKKEEIEDEKKTEKDEKNKSENVPEWAQVIMKKFSDFESSQKKKERAFEIGNRRKEIDKIIAKLPESIKKAYARIDLDIAEDDFSELKESIGKEVEDTITAFSSKRAAFNPPYAGGGDGSKEISKEEADKVAARLLQH